MQKITHTPGRTGYTRERNIVKPTGKKHIDDILHTPSIKVKQIRHQNPKLRIKYQN